MIGSYTVAKNATDSAMIIDAMDLLHTRRLDGFCIHSSDTALTGLARRIGGFPLTLRPMRRASDRR